MLYGPQSNVYSIRKAFRKTTGGSVYNIWNNVNIMSFIQPLIHDMHVLWATLECVFAKPVAKYHVQWAAWRAAIVAKFARKRFCRGSFGRRRERLCEGVCEGCCNRRCEWLRKRCSGRQQEKMYIWSYKVSQSFVCSTGDYFHPASILHNLLLSHPFVY